MSLFDTGVRPAIDQHLINLSKEERDYGDYWSASSAGYCQRKVIFDRLGVPPVKEDARKQRVFTVGHIFHGWIQEITKAAGLSIAQELELQDEELMIRGHIDDLVLVGVNTDNLLDVADYMIKTGKTPEAQHLILYDYKTQNSRAFSYKRPDMSYFHKMQLGTYMYMLRKLAKKVAEMIGRPELEDLIAQLLESRILKISKDDLRMSEEQLMWTPELEDEVTNYWIALNGYWAEKKFPPCTCADREGGFMAKEAYNPYYYDDQPCSLKWLQECKEKGLLK